MSVSSNRFAPCTLRHRRGRIVGRVLQFTKLAYRKIPWVRIPSPPPIFTFREIVRNSLGAKRLGMVFFRNLKGIFEIQNQSAVGNAEVRRAKLWQNEILQTNLFSFAFSEMLSVFFFDCPKTNIKTIWTT